MADFEMFQGDDIALDFAVKEDAADGEPVSLVGIASLRWWLSRKVTTPALVQKAIGAGVEITDAAAGEFTVRLEPADTEERFGTFYHEAEVIDADGKVSTVHAGEIIIKRALISG